MFDFLPGGAFAQSGDSQDFQYTGGEQIYTVPAGVTEVKIDAWGAAGGNDVHIGGLGGYANGELAVTTGEQLYIFTGGQGSNCTAGNGGGYNGGGNAGRIGCSGGGGGATDIRIGGTDIANRILVAGGGGGGGYMYQGGPGGANYGGNTLAGLFQGQPNSYDGGGGGGGYYGGNPGYYPYNPYYSYSGYDLGGFGGTSYIGGVQNGGTQKGVQTGNGHVKITILEQENQPPVTTASVISATPASDGWYSSAATLTLSAKDESSGIKKTEYQINDGDWVTYTKPVTFSQDGVYSVDYCSIDGAGNVETAQKENIQLDQTAPVTTAAVTSDKPANNNWYSSAITLTLPATDNLSGVTKTEYQINNGDWTPYTQAISFSEDGVYNVNYRSVDAAGNTEAIQSHTIQLDQTAPTLAVSLDKTELWAPNHKLVTVNAVVTANDSLSGVAKTELVSITSSEPESGSGDIQNSSYGTLDTSFDLRAERSGKDKAGRIYTITYRVTDVAGNVTTQSVTVTVQHDQKK